jgi:hypothetical protein
MLPMCMVKLLAQTHAGATVLVCLNVQGTRVANQLTAYVHVLIVRFAAKGLHLC